MGQRGRPRKPLALRVLSGERKVDRLKLDQPFPKRGIPPKPIDLGYIADEEWERMAPVLDRMGVLTEADGPALGLLCQWAEIVGKYLAAEGAMPLESRVPAEDPFGRALKSSQLYIKLLGLFGLTPADRTRVKSDGVAGRDELAEFLREREGLGG